jgi:hypothetical protein
MDDLATPACPNLDLVPFAWGSAGSNATLVYELGAEWAARTSELDLVFRSQRPIVDFFSVACSNGVLELFRPGLFIAFVIYSVACMGIFVVFVLQSDQYPIRYRHKGLVLLCAMCNWLGQFFIFMPWSGGGTLNLALAS